eukprot:TRINITY_DN6639_c0_g1_i1.p1 TRINITY_DN6639_c0_g1~~TRINITY_DN6639_c0_g1_i1.p1  ORF type:complete len:120 (+),score=29.12 TRINITY_DN6639_c0_g1_i1:60-419(+)
MHQASLGRTRRFDSRAGHENVGETGSVLSGGSGRSKLPAKVDPDRRITLKDIQLILPTALILVFTIVIMVTVIPYAFSAVLKQMEAVRAMEAAAELAKSITEEPNVTQDGSHISNTTEL